MKKSVKKKVEEVKPIVSVIENTTVMEEVKVEVKVNKLDIGFPNEDMNKVVAKLNEVIDKLND